MPLPTQEQLDRFLGNPQVYADKGYFLKAMREMDPRFAAVDPTKQEEIYTSLRSKFGGAPPAPEAPAQSAPAPASSGGVGEFLSDMFTGVRSGLRSTADFAGDLSGMVGLKPVQKAAHSIGESIVSDQTRQEASQRSPWGYGIGYGAEQLGEALLGGGAVKKGGQLALEQLGKSAIKAGAEAGAEAAAKATAEELAKAGAQRFAGKVVEKATQTVPGQMGIYSFVRGDEDGPFSAKAGARGAVEGYLFHKAGGIRNTPLAAAASGAVGATGAGFEASLKQSELEHAQKAYAANPTPENKQAVEKAQAQLKAANDAILPGFVMGAGMTAVPRMVPAVRQLTSMRVPGETKVSGETPGAARTGEAPTGALARESGIAPVRDAKGRSEAVFGGAPPADGGTGIGAAPAQGAIDQEALRIVKSKMNAEAASDAQVVNAAKTMAARPEDLAKLDPAYRDAVLKVAGAAPAAPAAASPAAKAKTGLTRDKLQDPQWLQMLESKPDPAEEINRAILAISSRKSGNTEITPGSVATQLIGQWKLFPKSGNTGQLSTAELAKSKNATFKGLKQAVEVYMAEKGIDFKPSSSPAVKPVEPTPPTPGETPAAVTTAEAPAAGAPPAAAGEKPALAEYKPGTASKIFTMAPREKLNQIIQEAAADPKVKNTNQLTSRIISGLGLKYSNEAHGEFKGYVADYLQKNPELAPNIKVVTPKKGSAAVPETPETPASGTGAAAPNGASAPPTGDPMAEAKGALAWLSQRFKANSVEELTDTIERLRRANFELPADVKAQLEILDRSKAGMTSKTPPPAAAPGASGFGTPRALSAEEEAAYNAVKEYSGAAHHDALLNWAAVNASNPNVPVEIHKAMQVVNKAFPVEVGLTPEASPASGVAPDAAASTAGGPSQGQISELITKLDALNNSRKIGEGRGTGNAAAIDASTKFDRAALAQVYPQIEKYSDDMIEKLGLFKRNADGTFSISDAVANAWTTPDSTRTAVTSEPAPKKKPGSRKRKPPVPETPEAPANAPAQEPVPPEAASGQPGVSTETATGAPGEPTPHTLQDQLSAATSETPTKAEAEINPQNGQPPLSAKERKQVAKAIENFREASGFRGNDYDEMASTALEWIEEDNALLKRKTAGEQLGPDEKVLPRPYRKAAEDLIEVYNNYLGDGRYTEAPAASAKGSKKK